MDLERGKVYQLIGSNGSGKTTLVDIISGRIHSDEGNVILDGNDITQSGQLETYRAGLVRTFQIPRPFRKLATIENMSVSATGRHPFTGSGANANVKCMRKHHQSQNGLVLVQEQTRRVKI